MNMKILKWQMLFRMASVLCVFLGIFASACAQEKPHEAWWLQVKFSANNNSYKGVGISAINPNWLKMTVLSYDLLPSEAKTDFSWMHKDGFVFSIEGRLSHKDTVEHMAVGVYEDRAGNSGRFLLVLRKDAVENWKKIFLHEELG